MVYLAKPIIVHEPDASRVPSLATALDVLPVMCLRLNMNANELQPYVGVPRKVRLERSFPSEPLHNGFVMGVGATLVLMQQFHDFYNEGYTALRLSDITSIRSGEYERHWEQMLIAERLIDAVGIEIAPPIGNFRELLTAIASRPQNVIVECESTLTADDDEFYIGRTIRIDGNVLVFHNFDALGKWSSDFDEIELSSISKIQFDTPYINIFSKYVTDRD